MISAVYNYVVNVIAEYIYRMNIIYRYIQYGCVDVWVYGLSSGRSDLKEVRWIGCVVIRFQISKVA